MALGTIIVSRNPTDFGAKLFSLQQKKKFCNARLIVNDEIIEVHANVLAASSKYFEHFFVESAVKQIIFENTEDKYLKTLIEYCYTGKIETTEDDMAMLINMAQDLWIDGFVASSAQALEKNIRVDNCLYIMNIGRLRNIENLKRSGLEFFKKNFVEASRSGDFLDLDYKALHEFINLDIVATDLNIFEAVRTWISFDTASRSQYFANLINNINFENLPIKIFASEPSLLHNLDPSCLEKFDKVLKIQETSEPMDDTPINEELINFDAQSTLMVVGASENFTSKFMEIYDKINQEWVETSELNILEKCYSTLLFNDKLLLIGGYEDKTTVQSYDLETGCMEDFTPLKHGRHHSSSVIFKREIYVVGGLNKKDSMSSVEKWSSLTKSWIDVASLNTGRYGHKAVVLGDKIYVVGGYGEKDLSSVESYDLTDKWTECKSMNEERGCCGVVSFQGYLYVVGGHTETIYSNTAERYDPKADVWTTIQSLNIIRYLMGTTIFMGQLVTAGSSDPFKICYIPLENRDDYSNQTWKPMNPLKYSRKYFDFVEVPWDLAEHVISRRSTTGIQSDVRRDNTVTFRLD